MLRFFFLVAVLVSLAGLSDEYKVIAKIHVGYGPYAITIAPDGSVAYVLDNENVRVSRIDLKSRQLLSPTGLLDMAYAIAVAPSGNPLFSITGDSLTAYDTIGVLNPVSLPAPLFNPVSVAISGDGLHAYTLSANYDQSGQPSSWHGYITRFNLITGFKELDIPVLQDPVAWAITSKGWAYVAHSSGALLPVDLNSGTLHLPIGIFNSPSSIAISPDDAFAYVLTQATNSVTPLKLSNRQILPPIALNGRTPLQIAVTSDRARAYVANQDSKSITPIDLKTRRALAPIALNQRPSRVAVTPDGKMLCVIYPDTDEVALVARIK